MTQHTLNTLPNETTLRIPKTAITQIKPNHKNLKEKTLTPFSPPLIYTRSPFPFDFRMNDHPTPRPSRTYK